jgi:cytochrome c556
VTHLPRTLVVALALTLTGAVLAPSAVRAQEGPTVAEYRQSLMQAFRTHMGGIGAAMSDAAPMGHAEHHAVAFERMALALANAFPEGSAGGRALPAIWEDRDDFMNKVTAIQTASARLVTASRTGDSEQIGTAMQGVRETCRGCHTTYRGPAN